MLEEIDRWQFNEIASGIISAVVLVVFCYFFTTRQPP
jgi:hypothetical protein